jgi:hypothetical protein
MSLVGLLYFSQCAQVSMLLKLILLISSFRDELLNSDPLSQSFWQMRGRATGKKSNLYFHFIFIFHVYCILPCTYSKNSICLV